MFTLHKAMELVLADRDCLSAAEIAGQINRLKLYTRGDKNPVPASQISARASKYPELFDRHEGTICLKGSARAVRKVMPSEAALPDAGHAVGDARPDQLVFRGLGSVGDLIERGLPADGWLGRCGIYKISVLSGYEPEFLGPEAARAAGNVISPWSVAQLEAKWVRDTDIVYIGLAGRDAPRSLRERLSDLRRHASGRTSGKGPHKGGEIVWQLRGYLLFHVSAAPTADPPAPREIESALLERFMASHRALPFGNRQK